MEPYHELTILICSKIEKEFQKVNPSGYEIAEAIDSLVKEFVSRGKK